MVIVAANPAFAHWSWCNNAAIVLLDRRSNTAIVLLDRRCNATIVLLDGG